MTTKAKQTEDSGNIYSFFFGVAKISGLKNVMLNEVLIDKEGKEVALVIGFNNEYTEALFFEENFDIAKKVFRSKKLFTIKVGGKYLGRIVDGTGKAIDRLPEIKGEQKYIFQPAPTIIERSEVNRPLISGIKIIDTTLPIGRGQRELIIGDRKTGKSSIVMDTILNQVNSSPQVYCVYVLCGVNNNKFEDIVNKLKTNDAFLNTIVVVAKSSDSLAAQYLAPFVGCTIAESIRDSGKDALIIYDDLSKHAKVYRDISLLLERPPGRETYPGDIFTLHATLLERACQLSKDKGFGSLTALPIIETQEGDITSFISTNLISISDGQIYLERGLFEKGYIPAVNVGLSVSRIGSKAQPKILQGVTGGIRLALSQYNQLQKLVQLETVLSKESRNQINRGELMLELLKQDKYKSVSTNEEVLLFYSIEEGLFDDVSIEKLREIEKILFNFIKIKRPDLKDKLESEGLSDGVKQEIKDIVTNLKEEL